MHKLGIRFDRKGVIVVCNTKRLGGALRKARLGGRKRVTGVMFHVDNQRVRELLLTGSFGLERESLRITGDGMLAKSPNPFEGSEHIVRDFSEHQVEINTSPVDSPAAAIAQLEHYDDVIQQTLQQRGEYLWPFSNPPYIRNEADVPIAQFKGEEASKTAYREYLSDRYGRYKMAFSGIHFNYSFSDELLQVDFALSGEDDFIAYKDALYVRLAERCVGYGWLMTAITAASPLMDSSFVEEDVLGRDLFMGFASPRCSELGYWNFFTPVLDYSSVQAYAQSIQHYIDKGYIKYPSELYYPIRIKPRGAYGLDTLAAGNVSHIELRMFDLNPLFKAGLNEADVFFGQLFLVWLASTPAAKTEEKDQIQAVQNFKNASRYDLKTVKIVMPWGEVSTVEEAALSAIDAMTRFYHGIDASTEVMECLEYQRSKFTDSSKRYSRIVHDRFSNSFVIKGLELARANRNRACGDCPAVR